MSVRKPLNNIIEFINAHNDIKAKMITYLHTKRGRKVDENIKTAFFDDFPSLLYATNIEVRKAVASASRKILKRKFYNTRNEFYFVTVAFSEHCTGISDPNEFNEKTLQRWVCN